MRTRQLLIPGLVFCASISASQATAGPAKPPRVGLGLPSSTAAPGARKEGLRKEVAQLRAQMAQLASAVNFMARTDAPGGPATGGAGSGGICGDPCATDSDDDGIGDCEDFCPCDPNTTDSDSDAIPDCADACPDDATNACLDPCNLDSDGDGIGDCEDPCPWNPEAAVDTDNDGTNDCSDPCPLDARNLCTDPCILDQDGDGLPDCKDPCPWEAATPDDATATCVPPPVALSRM